MLMPEIGNCDTCHYILKCDRACCTGKSLSKELLGCPNRLLEEYRKDCEEYLKETLR